MGSYFEFIILWHEVPLIYDGHELLKLIMLSVFCEKHIPLTGNFNSHERLDLGQT